MKVWKRVIGAACVLAGAVVGGTGAVDAGAVQQEIGRVELSVIVIGPEAANIEDTWYPELYEDGTNVRLQYCTGPSSWSDIPLASAHLLRCPIYDVRTFTLGFPQPPEGYTVDWFCEDRTILSAEAFDDPSATFTIDGDTTTDVYCQVTMSTHMLLLDKVFPSELDVEVTEPIATDPDGGASHGDFTLEAYSGSELVASGVDADARRCGGWSSVAEGYCVVLPLPAGEYVLGESFVPGYQAIDTNCVPAGSPAEDLIGPERLTERFDANESTTVTLGGGDLPGESVYCSVLNSYVQGAGTLTKTITNDDGGTAELGDFTLELFRASDGELVDSGVCQANGVCLQGTYPIDDYVVGETGPDGYTRTITQEMLLAPEQLTEAEAAFTLQPFAEVTVNVASNDNPQPATTTAAPTTTQGPTTTGIGAGVVTLPATGSSSNTGVLAAAAALLVLLGVGATVVTRRRS